MKEHVDVIKDSFIDFAGKIHYFVIAAVSRELDNAITFVDYPYPRKLVKGLHLGIAICNPEDKFEEKIGILKAISRARNSCPVMYVTNCGYINDTLVKAFLKQEADFLKANPNIYIKGYNEARERYLKRRAMEDLEENFTVVEKIVVDSVQRDPKFLDNINMYLDWLNKCKKHGK